LEIRRLALWLGIAPAVVGASLFAACGGDDDGGGGGTGSDEDYVADICDAMLGFQEDLEDLFKDPSKLADEEDAAKALAEPLSDLAGAFKKMKPPSDLKDWHKDASDALSEAADELKDGNLEADILTQDQPFPDPPKDAADRLAKIAEDNEDCQAADFNFES